MDLSHRARFNATSLAPRLNQGEITEGDEGGRYIYTFVGGLAPRTQLLQVLPSGP
jgi:hypothetical protein